MIKILLALMIGLSLVVIAGCETEEEYGHHHDDYYGHGPYYSQPGYYGGGDYGPYYGPRDGYYRHGDEHWEHRDGGMQVRREGERNEEEREEHHR
jgi:hypothetical protein